MVPRLTLDAALLRGRNNNLDLLRLLAASAVVISHAWPLALGPGAVEPLEHMLGVSLGGVAVLIFFFLSGMLVTASAVRTISHPMMFIRARALRVFPGLLAALVVTVLIAVACGAQISIAEAVIYVLRGLSLVSLQHNLEGAFAGNPYAGAVNGPLWTLFYEVACYALFAGAVWLGLLRHAAGWIIAGSLILGLWGYFDILNAESGNALMYRLSVMSPLLLSFFFGALFWHVRVWLILSWKIGFALALGGYFTMTSQVLLPVLIIALGYWMCLLAYRLPELRLKGDISYGIYVYGWPVAQMVIYVFGPMTPLMLAGASLLVVIPFAIASWVLVEKPALSLTRKSSRPLPVGVRVN